VGNGCTTRAGIGPLLGAAGEDRGEVAVDVQDGHVVGAACQACGNTDFVVLVEGKNQFWPVDAGRVY